VLAGQEQGLLVLESVDPLEVLVPSIDVLLALGLQVDLDEVFWLVVDEMTEFFMVDPDLILSLLRLLLLLVRVTHRYMFE
jgi:hypothetical protein